MSIEQITSAIKLILDGRKIVGRIRVERNDGAFEVWAPVLNADGCGKRDTMLASFSTASEAVTVQRTLIYG